MKINEDVHQYALQKGIDEQKVLEEGIKEKAEEFVSKGAEIYQKA